MELLHTGGGCQKWIRSRPGAWWWGSACCKHACCPPAPLPAAGVAMSVNVSYATEMITLTPTLEFPGQRGVRVEVNGQVLSRGGDVLADQARDTDTSAQQPGGSNRCGAGHCSSAGRGGVAAAAVGGARLPGPPCGKRARARGSARGSERSWVPLGSLFPCAMLSPGLPAVRLQFLRGRGPGLPAGGLLHGAAAGRGGGHPGEGAL